MPQFVSFSSQNSSIMLLSWLSALTYTYKHTCSEITNNLKVPPALFFFLSVFMSVHKCNLFSVKADAA